MRRVVHVPLATCSKRVCAPAITGSRSPNGAPQELLDAIVNSSCAHARDTVGFVPTASNGFWGGRQRPSRIGAPGARRHFRSPNDPSLRCVLMTPDWIAVPV